MFPPNVTARLFRTAPARVLVRALLFCCVAPGFCCDRRPQGQAGGPRSQPASDDVAIKLAALRHLIAQQPRAADRGKYAAYLIKDDAAGELAAASGDGGEGPPVVATLDAYTRKGRTMDPVTGRPVKVFRVGVTRPPTPDGRAEAVASWSAGRLEGATYRYRLRKSGGAWAVTGRVEEERAHDP